MLHTKDCVCQVDEVLATAARTDTMKMCKSGDCTVVLVEPLFGSECHAEDDGMRLLTGVHELHLAYQQLLKHLKIAHVVLPSASVEARVSRVEEACSHMQHVADKWNCVSQGLHDGTKS